MSCPTCNSATMQKIDDADFPTFWCSRCGTLKTPQDDLTNVGKPSLIALVRGLVTFKDAPPGMDVWTWRAVREAVGFDIS